jgi:hypothetical protein
MRRKLKSVITLAGIPQSHVHDRQATSLPHNAHVHVVTVADPYERGAHITAIRSIRDDPLGRLHAHGQVDDAQFYAGREWQRHYEHSQLQPSSQLRDPVDGGGACVDALEHAAKSLRVVMACSAVLGHEGDTLIRQVLGERWFLATVAIARNLNPHDGSRDMRYLGRRLQECLETLARYFRYA